MRICTGPRAPPGSSHPRPAPADKRLLFNKPCPRFDPPQRRPPPRHTQRGLPRSCFRPREGVRVEARGRCRDGRDCQVSRDVVRFSFVARAAARAVTTASIPWARPSSSGASSSGLASMGWLLCCADDSVPPGRAADFRILGRWPLDGAGSTGRVPARSPRCARGSCRSSRRRSGHPASRSRQCGRRALLGRPRIPRCRRAPVESRHWA
jgi:hypothetical protein